MTASPRFEDRLLEQLRQVVADHPVPHVAATRRPHRTRLALAGVGVAAAAAAVAVVATSNDRSHSAYAVQPQADGAVTVTIHSLSDANGLQGSLRAAGIPAVVDYVPSATGDCAAPGPPPASPSTQAEGGTTESGPTLHTGTAGSGPSLSQQGEPPAGADGHHATMSIRSTQGGDATFTIDPGTLKPGEKVFITTSTEALGSVGMAIATRRPTAACVPSPPAP